MNKNAITLAIVVAATAAVGAWYYSHQATAGSKAAGLENAAPTVVTAVAAQRQDVPVRQTATGSVVALKSVELHPQTTATIRQVHIREGQFVKQGDLLFSLDDRNDRANLDKARAQSARDHATLVDLQRQFKRSQELMEKKFIAQGAVDTLASQVEAQKALVQQDAAAVQAAEVAMSYNTIRAPMAGRVGAITVYPGSLVQPTLTVVTVTQLDPIAVSFTLPESSLQALLEAQKRGPVGVQATVPGGAQTLKGSLSFVDNTVDPQAGVIRVKAQFDNRDTALWPGQYANTEVTVQTLKDAVVIPLAAVIAGSRGKLVYTIEADGSAKAHPVTVVHTFANNAAITGLAGGEKVIVDGKQNLRPGSKVREAAIKPAAAAAPNPAVAATAAPASASASGKGRAE